MNLNLQGFSPVNGFFDKYAKEMEKAKEGDVQFLFMADNLFIS
jgi:hypothetical protein